LTAKNPDDVSIHLYELVFNLEVEEAPYVQKIVETLGTYLEARNTQVRRVALLFIDRFLEPDNANQFKHILEHLVGLLTDRNWKIRLISYDMLKEVRALPDDFRLSFWDRLRKRFLNPFK